MGVIKPKLKNCPVCGRVFYATRALRVCRDCRDKELEMERVVINYVRDHPKCTIPEIVEETGASQDLVKRMVEEGRFIEFAEVRYPCKKCGRPINGGKYCKSCLSTMTNTLQKANKSIRMKQLKEREGTYSDAMADLIGKK